MEAYKLNPGERWYVARTQQGRELRACLQLNNQNFRTFLPRGLRTIRHARKFTTVTVPFFPQYLFVVLDLTRDRWRSINGTTGVTSLIMRGELPHPVPHGVVETLTTFADVRGLLRFGANLRRGERVRLIAGPFAERLATCERLDDQGRARVLLEIMGAQVSVQVRRDYLIPAT